MSELKYSKDGRLLFTKEMIKDYKVLIPDMLPIHFEFMKNILLFEGYDAELLTNNSRQIVNEGLMSVHNDACFPALLVIGQFIDAMKSGKYDTDKVALMITQTGGGCRASNYIHLLRKALKKSGFEHVPVISLNLSGMEKNPGFKLSIPLLKKLVYSILYGDLLMMLANQTRPYEINSGETEVKIKKWTKVLAEEIKNPKNVKYKRVKENFDLIVKDFGTIKLNRVPKVKVGVVGEIYIKYAPVGNNNLEDFLQSEGAEVCVPGLLDFIIFKVNNRSTDCEIYRRKYLKKKVVQVVENFFIKVQNDMIASIKNNSDFRAPETFGHLRELVKGYVGHGNKMGEGWLLTGEMLELISSGFENIVCAQPFGCLPNHVAGKGMIRKIKDNNERANIVAIDYDPGATKINQENRIKLMLATAKLNLQKSQEEDNKKAEDKNKQSEADRTKKVKVS